MTTLGSAPMDLSRGMEGVMSQIPVTRNSFHSRVTCMRRSSLGEVHIYKEVRQIGSGGFGNCFLLERKTDKARRVCKVQAREYQDDARNGVPLEVNILRDLLPRHDRILHLHEFLVQPSTVQLYYDYYEGGDLHQLIGRYYDQWQDIPETFLWHVYLQMSEAVAFLHYGYDRRQLRSFPADWTAVIHGDIKDRNIFLGPPDPSSSNPLAREYPSLVLGDFGMADLEPSNRYGTPQWQPPELPTTSMKADVWELGAVIHALAHEGKPPLAPLPRGFTWEDWCDFPGSRDPIPLYGLYSDELHDCVFSALALQPHKRLNSYDLHYKVMKEWCLSIGPYCSQITPLIPTMETKCYNENGATIRSTAGAPAVKRNFVGTDAVEVCVSIGNEVPPDQTERKVEPTPSIIGKKRVHSQSNYGTRSLVLLEEHKGSKRVKTDSGIVDSIMPIAESTTRPTLPCDFAQIFACQPTWLSSKELMIMRMQDSIQSSTSPFPTANKNAYEDEGNAIENVIDDLELHTVAAVVHSETMAFDIGTSRKSLDHPFNNYTNTMEQAAQLHAALASTIRGTDFEIDPSGWFVNAGDRMYVFQSANEKNVKQVLGDGVCSCWRN